MFSKFYVHPLFFIFVLLFLIMGNIRPLLLFMLLILVHECGHFLTARLLGWKVDKIYIYPYGGVSKFNEKVNVPLKQELFVLLMGPLTQCFFFCVMKNVLPLKYVSILTEYHYFILIFNLLPIYPLDGGRLLNLFLSIFLPFKKSLHLSIFLSYFFLLFLLILSIFPFSLFFSLVLLFTLLKVWQEEKNNKYLFQKFLLERRLYSFPFKRKKIISSREEMYRDCNHLFRKNFLYYTEEEYLMNKNHDF